MVKICLIRHGETDWNRESRLQGRTDIELNQFGELQANKIGEYLNQFTWHRIISSPLKRAKRTAELIGKVLDIDEIIIDEGLIEKYFGLAEGMTIEERLEKYPDKQYEGMEDWNTLRDRVYSTIVRYAEESEDINIVMVSHGAAINTVLHTLSNGEYGSGVTTLHNGSVNMINYNNGSFEVEFYNLKSY